MGKMGAFLGGAIQGIGAGLVEHGKQKAEIERLSATQRFQEYLATKNNEAASAREAQKQQWASDAASTAHTQNLERDKLQAGYKSEQAEKDAKNTLTRDGVLHSNDVDIEKIRAGNQRTLATLQSTLNLSEAEHKAAIDLNNDVSKLGLEVGHTEITTDGRMILYSKAGGVLRASPPGTFNPKNATEETDLLGGRGAPTAKPAPAPRPTPAARPAAAPAAKPSQVKRPSLDDIFGPGHAPGQPSAASTLTSTFSR